MANIGFLGCGTIGCAMVKYIQKKGIHQIAFIQDPFFKNDCDISCKVINEKDETVYEAADLVVECANASVLKENIDALLKHSNLLIFSVTAFSDDEFMKKTAELCEKYQKHIYFPHGAILGMDGISDAKPILTSVTIETTKNPKSLGRDDQVRTIVYEGCTREACKLYPRNVNVHASVALAGLGFEKTHSKIISDPAVHTNSHKICVEGEGISFQLNISTFSSGGVTGFYTPISACGSLDRVLGGDSYYMFV